MKIINQHDLEHLTDLCTNNLYKYEINYYYIQSEHNK